MGKTEDFGAKNNKETYIFLKQGSFRSAQVGKAEQKLYIFEKGVFWSSPGQKSRGFRSGQS